MSSNEALIEEARQYVLDTLDDLYEPGLVTRLLAALEKSEPGTPGLSVTINTPDSVTPEQIAEQVTSSLAATMHGFFRKRPRIFPI